MEQLKCPQLLASNHLCYEAQGCLSMTLESLLYIYFLSRQFAFIYKPDKNGSLETLVFTILIILIH